MERRNLNRVTPSAPTLLKINTSDLKMERRNLNKVTPSAPTLSELSSKDLKMEHSPKTTPTAPVLTPDDTHNVKIPKLYPKIENDLKMEHPNLEKMSSTAPMLPADDAVSIKVPAKLNCGAKILIREDTVLNNYGCAGCGRKQFTCTGVKEPWSVLCWGRQSEKKYYCLLILLSATFTLSLLGTVFFCFTNTINDAILSNMVIRNNSLAYSVWRRPSVHPLMKVHIFNYTNWQRVKDGIDQKLEVEELGPYTYTQQLERVNIKFDKDRLSYQEMSHFRYLPELTVGAHFDQLNVPNLPLLGVFSKAISMGLAPWQNSFMNAALLLVNHREAFLKLPVHRFLWGYDDDIISTAKTWLQFQFPLRFKQFGLLSMKNDTISEKFTINTGELEKDKMNVIEQVDNKEALNYWDGEECNSIDATDGTIFPPSLLDKKQILYAFTPNLCRRLPFVFEKEIEISNGVKLYRYRMPEDVFDDPKHNPYNQCYCEIDSGVCPPRGVINVSACTMGAPAMVSFPHFHRGDPKLREDIIGLRPNASRHESYVDIHPTLGIALQGRSSLQVNIQVKKTSAFTPVSYLDEGLILPIAWIEMGVEELPESLKSLVYHGTYSTAAVQLGLTVICVIALIVSSICLFLLIVQRRQKPCVTLKKIPVELITSKIESKQES